MTGTQYAVIIRMQQSRPSPVGAAGHAAEFKSLESFLLDFCTMRNMIADRAVFSEAAGKGNGKKLNLYFRLTKFAFNEN